MRRGADRGAPTVVWGPASNKSPFLITINNFNHGLNGRQIFLPTIFTTNSYQKYSTPKTTTEKLTATETTQLAATNHKKQKTIKNGTKQRRNYDRKEESKSNPELRNTVETYQEKTTLQGRTELETLTILSLNPDNFIGSEKQDDIIRELQRNRIHIAAIRETQIPNDTECAKKATKS